MATSKTKEDLLPFAKATQIQRLGTHVYAGNFSPDFCIGAVPNGGYVTTHFLKIASLHLSSPSPSPSRRPPQPDTLSAHLSFLSRTSVGPALFVVEDTKLGRGTSVLHIRLYQHPTLVIPSAGAKLDSVPPPSSSPAVVSYITQTSIPHSTGLSLPTSWTLLPPPSPPPQDFTLLAANRDPIWSLYQPTPGSGFTKIRNLKNMDFFFPRQGQLQRSMVDMWVRLCGGEKWGNENGGLGFLVDGWPTVVEGYRPLSPSYSPPPSKGKEAEEEKEPFAYDEVFWYPTVSLNLEVKKRLAPEGEEWLFVRTMAREIRDGRLDLEVLVIDREGDLVAVSGHVALVVAAERNLKGREKL